MATTRRRNFRTHTSQRRKLVWAELGGAVGALGGAGTGANFDLLGNYRTLGGSTQGITVIRTHLTVQALWVAANVGAAEAINCGLIIDDNNITAAELSSARNYDDWMLLKQLAPGANSFVAGTGLVSSWEVDLKAKRKCQELQQTYWLTLSCTTAQTPAVNFLCRTLLALP